MHDKPNVAKIDSRRVTPAMNARDFDLAMGGTPGGMLLKLITGNGKQDKEHREPGTGKGEQESKSECTAVTLLIIQRKKQGTLGYM